MSKYQTLKRFLITQSVSEVPMSFDEVETTLGFSLPRSARRYAPWWANETEGGHVQARAWLDAGWRTSRVDVPGERVVFVRANPEPPVPQSGSRAMSGAVSIEIGALPLPAARLLREYAQEAGGDFTAAVARGLQEAAIARRAKVLARFPLAGERSPVDSVDLIREDRDAR